MLRHLFIVLSWAFTALFCGTLFAEDDAGVSEWIPSAAMGDDLRESATESLIPEVTITQTPKPTADASKYPRRYTLELGNR